LGVLRILRSWNFWRENFSLDVICPACTSSRGVVAGVVYEVLPFFRLAALCVFLFSLTIFPMAPPLSFSGKGLADAFFLQAVFSLSQIAPGVYGCGFFVPSPFSGFLLSVVF